MLSHYLYTKTTFMKKNMLIRGPLYLIMSYLLTQNLTLNVIYKIVYILSFFTGGAVMASWIVASYLLKYSRHEIHDENYDISYTEYERYNKYINDHYEEFRNILSDKNKLIEYKNTDKKFINSLKDKDKHFSVELPYNHNNKIIIFYDNDVSGYIYYTKSDVDCKILNSVCRNYVIKNKCINLFTDEEELKYIKTLYGDDVSDNSNCIVDENIEEKEEDTGFVSIFYSKKKNKKVLKNIECNKFIYRGNILDYENIYNNSEKDVKQISYSSYIYSKKD